MNLYSDLLNQLSKKQEVWLITGVAGFIGSNLLETLLVNNQKVIGLDNFSTGSSKNLDEIRRSISSSHWKNFSFIEGDIRSLESCVKACKNADYVLHQAALGSVPRSIKDPLLTNEVNINGFLNILTAAKESSVKKIVYAASSSTYGDHPDLPKVENKIGNPLSPYAVTKYVNELYAGVFSKVYDLNLIGLRYFNVFGKRQDPHGAYAAVIPKWINSLLANEDLFINGLGDTSRDFCYIENVVQANILAAKNDDRTSHDVYNIAFGSSTSLTELFYLIKSNIEDNNFSVIQQEPFFRDYRDGDVKHSLANINKAINDLSYNPEYSIEDGLKETMNWYIKNST
jgi:nucleoside-diphosphate-sugar epimerase